MTLSLANLPSVNGCLKAESFARVIKQNGIVLMKALNLSITASILVGRGAAKANRRAGPANPGQKQSHQKHGRGDETSEAVCRQQNSAAGSHY